MNIGYARNGWYSIIVNHLTDQFLVCKRLPSSPDRLFQNSWALNITILRHVKSVSILNNFDLMKRLILIELKYFASKIVKVRRLQL